MVCFYCTFSHSTHHRSLTDDIIRIDNDVSFLQFNDYNGTVFIKDLIFESVDSSIAYGSDVVVIDNNINDGTISTLLQIESCSFRSFMMDNQHSILYINNGDLSITNSNFSNNINTNSVTTINDGQAFITDTLFEHNTGTS